MSAKKASSGNEEKREHKGAPTISAGLIANAVAVLCAVGAFVGVVALYRFVFPIVPDAIAADAAGQSPDAMSVDAAATEAQPVGVEDIWYATGVFTTGDNELDQMIKAFCDAHTEPGNTVEENAHNVYNTIVMGDFAERSDGELPSGPYWASAAAHEYLSSANLETGEAGVGDVYDYAATLAYCLRYFGFFDAIAVPTVATSTSGEDSAVCVLTGVDGYERVCVPSLVSNGWMLDRYMYTVVVKDIGQDLTQAQAKGLPIQERETDMTISQTTMSGQSPTSDQSADQSTDQSVDVADDTQSGESYDAASYDGYDGTTSYDAASYDAYDEYAYN